MGSRSKALHQRARAVIPGGVSSAQRSIAGLESLVVAGTSGAYFTDADGKRYLDFHAAFGPHVLGHADPDVDRAFFDAAQTIDLMGVGVTEQEILLAEKITEVVPSVERVFLTSSGSEATFYALRLARAATGRRRVIKFQGCYHGWHDSVAMNVISTADRVGRRDPIGAGMSPEVIDATIVCRFNDLADVEQAVDEYAGEVAAIIVEPIPHNIGTVLPQPGFLETLRVICDRNGIVLIFDEVITGFRHHLGGYQTICGVMPDLTALGKAVANGYPLGALGGRAELMDRIAAEGSRQVFAAGTYNGHPAVAAAALETIRKLEQERVHEHIYRLGERARTELAALYAELGVQVVVSGFGSVFVTYFLEPPVISYDDLLRNDADMFVGYRRELIRRGVFELPLNLKRNHVSYAHTDADIDLLLEETKPAVQLAAQKLARAG